MYSPNTVSHERERERDIERVAHVVIHDLVR